MNAPKKIWVTATRWSAKQKHDDSEQYIRSDIVEEMRDALSDMLTYTAELDCMQGYDDEHDYEAVKKARAALKRLEEE